MIEAGRDLGAGGPWRRRSYVTGRERSLAVTASPSGLRSGTQPFRPREQWPPAPAASAAATGVAMTSVCHWGEPRLHSWAGPQGAGPDQRLRAHMKVRGQACRIAHGFRSWGPRLPLSLGQGAHRASPWQHHPLPLLPAGHFRDGQRLPCPPHPTPALIRCPVGGTGERRGT